MDDLTPQLFEECGYRPHSEINLTEQPASLASLFPTPPALHPAYTRERQNSTASESHRDGGIPCHPAQGGRRRADTESGEPRGPSSQLDVNTNGCVYSQLFWLNPLLPKDHLNFLGYHDVVGPVCISTLPSGESGWYHVFVRTPLKFSLVQVPLSRLEGAEARAIQRFLPAKAPHKLLLYFVLDTYFQQVDISRARYRDWQAQAEQLTGGLSGLSLLPSFAETVASGPPHSAATNTLVTRVAMSDPPSFANDSADTSPSPPPMMLPEHHDNLESDLVPNPQHPNSPARGTSRGNTTPNKHVRWPPLNVCGGDEGSSSTGSTSQPSMAVSNASTLCDMMAESTLQPDEAPPKSSLNARHLLDLVLAIEPLNGESLKPALRNLEPRLIRRYHDVDIVVCHSENHSSSHLQFQRFLQILGQPFTYQQLWASIPRSNMIPGAVNPVNHPLPADTLDPIEETFYRPTKVRSAASMAEKRASIIHELVYTERSYVQKLQALIAVYVVPLRSASRSGKSQLIPTYMANAIFTNVEQLVAVNEAFLADLEKLEHENEVRERAAPSYYGHGHRPDETGVGHLGCFSDDGNAMDGNWSEHQSVGQICLHHVSNFDVYKRYINGYQHALECSSQLEKKNESYRHFLARSRDHPSCHKLGISDLLVMPVQRIPRYTLLFTDLLKNTPVGHPDHSEIQRALDRVHEIGQLADNQITDALTELHTIHGHIAECPASLISASRRLLISIDATELDFSTSTILKHVTLYLFTDRIMIVERPPHITGSQSTSKKKVYKFLTWMDICSMEVLETTGPGSTNRFYMQCHETPCLDPYWEAKPLHAFSVSGTNDRQRWVQRFYAAHALRRSAILMDDPRSPGIPNNNMNFLNPMSSGTSTAASASSSNPSTATANQSSTGSSSYRKHHSSHHRLYRQFHQDEFQIVFHVHYDVNVYLDARHKCDTVFLYTDDQTGHSGGGANGENESGDCDQGESPFHHFVNSVLVQPREAHLNPHMVGVVKSQRGRMSLSVFNRSLAPMDFASNPLGAADSTPPPMPPPMRSSSLAADEDTDSPQTAATVAAALMRASKLFGNSPSSTGLKITKDKFDSANPSAANSNVNSFIGEEDKTVMSSMVTSVPDEGELVRPAKAVTSLGDFEREFLDEVLNCKSDLLHSMVHLPTQQLYNQLFLESLFGLHLTPVQSYAYTAYTPLKRSNASQFSIASPSSFTSAPIPITPSSAAFIHRSPSTGSITQPTTPSSAALLSAKNTPHHTPSSHGAGAPGTTTFIVNTNSPPASGSGNILRRARNWTSRLVKTKRSNPALAAHQSFAMANEGRNMEPSGTMTPARNAVSIDGHQSATNAGMDLGYIKPTSLGLSGASGKPSGSISSTQLVGGGPGGGPMGKPPAPGFISRNSFASISSTALVDPMGGTNENSSMVRSSVYSSGAGLSGMGGSGGGGPGSGGGAAGGRPLSIFGSPGGSIFGPLQSNAYFSILGKYKIKSGTSRRNLTDRRPKSMVIGNEHGNNGGHGAVGATNNSPLAVVPPQQHAKPYHSADPNGPSRNSQSPHSASTRPLSMVMSMSPPNSTDSNTSIVGGCMTRPSAGIPKPELPDITSSPLNFPMELMGSGSFLNNSSYRSSPDNKPFRDN
ncbi:hypothetical protein H4R33_002838 [Dimargaris cristalligena]|nr:hypothetical protein H4R33_002838 [Dimargaris cristalligena]